MAEQLSGGNELLNPQKILKKIGISFGDKVADLGCGGAAFFTLTAARLVGNKGIIYAVDVLKPVLASVESKAFLNGLKNIKTIWTNLEIYKATPIPNESLDYAMLINILFQSNKRPELLKESIRLTKKGGKLVIIDWMPTEGPLGPPPKTRLKETEVRQLASRLNLKELEYFRAGTYHYGFIFQK